MQSKVSVVLVKSKSIDNSSDINKMSVHLEQMLAEKDRVDLKVRQGVTDASIRSSNFIVFCGYDSAILAEFFKSLTIIENLEDNLGPILFLYDEPGQSIWDHLNYILRSGMDLGRVNPKVFDKIISTWSHRDIISTVEINIRKLGTESITNSLPASDGGNVPETSGA